MRSQPDRKRRKKDAIVERLTFLIQQGVLAEDQVLPPQAISGKQNMENMKAWAALLGAAPPSSFVINEALHVMEGRGMVRIEPKRVVVVGYIAEVPFAKGLSRIWAALSPSESEVRQIENWFPRGVWAGERDHKPYATVDFDDVPLPLRERDIPDYLKMVSVRMSERSRGRRRIATTFRVVIQDIIDPSPIVRRVLLRNDGEFVQKLTHQKVIEHNLRAACYEICATRNGLRALREWANAAGVANVEVYETVAWIGIPFVTTKKRSLEGHYFLDRSSHGAPGEYRHDDLLTEQLWSEFERLTASPYVATLSDERDDPIKLYEELHRAYLDKWPLLESRYPQLQTSGEPT